MEKNKTLTRILLLILIIWIAIFFYCIFTATTKPTTNQNNNLNNISNSITNNSLNNTINNITTNTVKNTVIETTTTTAKEDYYLENSDGEDFFYNVLCGVTGITNTKKTETETEIIYKGSDNIHDIEVRTNLDNKIKYIWMSAIRTKDPTNFFMAATRLKYTGMNIAEATDYIVSNLSGNYKYIIKYIGNAQFKYDPGYGIPILQITASK